MHNAFIKKIDLNEPLILFDQFSFIEFKEIDALCGNDIFLIIQWFFVCLTFFKEYKFVFYQIFYMINYLTWLDILGQITFVGHVQILRIESKIG